MNVTDNTSRATSEQANSTIADNSTEPTPRVWDIRWFGYLAAPLLFATIIVPVFAGPTIRGLFKHYDRFYGFWRVVFILIWVYFFVAYYLFGAVSLILFCDALLVAHPAYRMVKAGRQRQMLKHLASSTIKYDALIVILAMVCVSLDIFGNLYASIPVPWGLVGWFVLFVVRLIMYLAGWGLYRKPKPTTNVVGDSSNP